MKIHKNYSAGHRRLKEFLKKSRVVRAADVLLVFILKFHTDNLICSR